MTENNKNTSNYWEDDDDIIPDMSDTNWLSRFEKAPITRGACETIDAQGFNDDPPPCR